MRPITSLTRFPSSITPLSASFASARSGVARSSHRRAALPLATTAASGWLISWAIDAVNSPIVVSRATRREFRLRLLDRGIGADALGLIHRHADELDHLAGLVEHRIAYGVDMLDRAVEQHRAVGNVVRLLLPHRSRAHLLEQGPILRVNQLEKQVERHLGRCRIDAEYLPHLRRPEQLAGLRFSRPESGVTELPGLGQIGRRAVQVAFRLVAGGDVDRRRKIDRRVRFAAGDRRDERIDPDRRSVLVPVSRHDFVVFARAVSKLGETGLARVAVPVEEQIDRRQDSASRRRCSRACPGAPGWSRRTSCSGPPGTRPATTFRKPSASVARLRGAPLPSACEPICRRGSGPVDRRLRASCDPAAAWSSNSIRKPPAPRRRE